MMSQSVVTFSDTLPKTLHPYQIYASETAAINTHKADFQKAICIVDAQFYYSKPSRRCRCVGRKLHREPQLAICQPRFTPAGTRLCCRRWGF